MGILTKLFGFRKNKEINSDFQHPSEQEPIDNSLESFKQKLWNSSPESHCGVCGKKLRGNSGSVITGKASEQLMKIMFEGRRYICINCGFISCFDCCTDIMNNQYKAICKKCNSEMQIG